MNINHISVSRKKCFDKCAQQYKYRYHLKLPRPGPEPYYFTYGKIVHRVAEEFVRAGGEVPIGEISKDLLRGKILLEEETTDPPPVIESAYTKKYPKHLRAIEKLSNKVGFDGQLEYEFRYDIDPPNNREVTGFIDRLIIRDDKAFIIDYKTTKKGKFRVNEQTVKYDLQLRMYSRVVQKEFGIEPENIKAALFYLEGENIIASNYTESSLALAEADLRDSHIEIEEADADRVWGNVGWHCKNCDYHTMCPFYKPTTTKQDVWDGDMSSLGF